MERQIFLPLCCSYTCCYFSCHNYTRCDIFVFLGKRLAPVKSTRLPTNRTDNAPPTSTNNTLVREWPTLGLHNWHQSNWKMKNQLDRKLMFLLQCPEKTLIAVLAKVVNFIIVDINVWTPSQTLDFWVVRAESISACDNDSHVLRPCSVYVWRIGCTTTSPALPRYSCCTTTPPLFPPLLHSSTPDPYLVLFFLFFSSYSASWYTSLLLNSSSSFANHVFVLRTPFHEVVKKAIFRFGTENGDAHLTRTPYWYK